MKKVSSAESFLRMQGTSMQNLFSTDFLEKENLVFFDMRKSAGAGVRVITPMGVLRFEYGMKLDARDGESPDRFEFTVSGLF